MSERAWVKCELTRCTEIRTESGELVAEVESPKDGELIRSAPELLEACGLALAGCKLARSRPFQAADVLRFVEMTLRAAIAMARGDKP